MASARTPLRVAVVGGGIGGLALAATLDPRLVTTSVHEAEPGRAAIGAGIVLWPDTVRTLARIGLRRSVELAATPVRGGAVRDLTGRPLTGMPSSRMLLLPRPALLDLLETAVPPSVCRVAGEVRDPRRLDADLVVGADGVRSRVRRLVWPGGAARRETPWVALRGVATRPPTTEETGEYWGAGLLLGVMALGPGHTYWFTSHRSGLGPEPLDPREVVAEVRARLAGTAARPLLDRLLAETGTDPLATRLWTTPALPRYVNGRYVVLGDAAHAMTPNLGRGACEAILDAVSLGRALNHAVCRDAGSRCAGTASSALGGSGPSADARDAAVRRALRAWQLRRLPPTQTVRIASSAVMRAALAGRGQGLRNTLFRLLP